MSSAPPEELALLVWITHDLIESINMRDPYFRVGESDFDLLDPGEAVKQCRSLLALCDGRMPSRSMDIGPALRAAAVHLGRLIELEIAEQVENEPLGVTVMGRYLLRQAATALEWPAPRNAASTRPKDWAGSQYLFVRRWMRGSLAIENEQTGIAPPE